MRKSDVKKLKKNQRVSYGGYEWKFHKACPYVNGIVMIKQKNRKPKYFAKVEVHC